MPASPSPPPDEVQLVVDGVQVVVADRGGSLLGALRDQLGITSVKDGCSPQGQCGCCTVLVDGAPRVSCVTPVRRVAGRSISTVDGLDAGVRADWSSALCASGGSQCGFCTPGIVVRLSALRAKGTAVTDHGAVERALQAHLCRCTGWQTIIEAWDGLGAAPTERDLDAASQRATIEGGAPQLVAPAVAEGRGGFADDTAPDGCLVAVRAADGAWVVGESVEEARSLAGKVQGRRTTVDPAPPLAVPEGAWDATLRTSWVEPGYLETDATWCEPGGEPASSLANGGAFGAKDGGHLGPVARELADRHGRPVRVIWSREDVVRLGPKRPPVAGGALADGTGRLVVVRTPGIADAVARVAPGLVVEEVDAPGPPTSAHPRAAGWAEAVVLLAGSRGSTVPVVGPDGGRAEAAIVDGRIQVRVAAGDPLDPVVLRSYAIGAAHMAYGWVTSEGLAVDGDGTVHDLTIRSFGIPRAVDTPPIDVEIDPSAGPPVNGSDAVFAAVAAAIWLHQGCPPDLPTRGAL
ncbi:2Fe-2S iron-sulfur cluster-binding protein [Aquihabitans daechungensis]|uniref:2Fe-2S iron-sulfur cluster-binding protein n=1 Tax=Aquihabitans daechungensis TaxID=1052257 RepID=UPI003BA3ABFA